jgi:hypothetical protein
MEKIMSDESKVIICFLLCIAIVTALSITYNVIEDQRRAEVKLEMIKSGSNPLEVGCAFINMQNRRICEKLLEIKKNEK